MAQPARKLTFGLDAAEQKVFMEEAEEQLELLDSALVELESDYSAEVVQRVFRAAHTLKGSSASIGHTKMAGLTHAMETSLDAVRNGRLEVGREVVDLLLKSVDALRLLCDEVATLRDSGVNVHDMERGLLALVDGADDGPAPVAAAAVAPAPAGIGGQLAAGRSVLRVSATVSPDCQLPGIRCFQVLQELDAIGEVIASDPPRSVIEEGNAGATLSLVVATNASESEVAAGVSAINDVSNVVIEAVTADDQAAEEETADSMDAETSAGSRVPQLTVMQGGAAEAAPVNRKSQSVRIDVERLDGLMNLVGELVIDRTRLQRIRGQLAASRGDDALATIVENFEETTAHLTRITDELHEEIVRTRMLPVRSVLTRLPRLVRNVAARCEKRVELVTAGEDTELDRSVIEELADPLVHIIRNAIDHGIESPAERRALGKPETGTVSVRAWSQETYIYLAIADDGKGVDVNRLRKKAVEKGLLPAEVAESSPDDVAMQYIFLPGLSTAAAISDISGRGVGMDIVRTNVEQLGGTVSVSSELGKGTEILIQLPLTLATTKALLVVAAETVYAIPLVSVTEALPAAEADLHTVGGHLTLRLRGHLLPLVDLAAALGDRGEKAQAATRYVVAVRHREHQVAFLVDRLLGQQDVVVKSLGDLVGNRRGLSGATILGDGALGLIVNVAGLVADQIQPPASAQGARGGVVA